MAPRKEIDPDSRASERSNVFLSATLYSDTGSFPVRIRNISPGGALLDGTNLPAIGSSIRLARAHLTAEGEIAWQSHDFRGLRFRSTVDVQEWVKSRAHAGQQRVDQAIAQIRAERRSKIPVEQNDDQQNLDSVDAICAALDQISKQLAASRPLTEDFDKERLQLEAIVRALRRVSFWAHGR